MLAQTASLQLSVGPLQKSTASDTDSTTANNKFFIFDSRGESKGNNETPLTNLIFQLNTRNFLRDVGFATRPFRTVNNNDKDYSMRNAKKKIHFLGRRILTILIDRLDIESILKLIFFYYRYLRNDIYEIL
jgi:hypothetical protein